MGHSVFGKPNGLLVEVSGATAWGLTISCGAESDMVGGGNGVGTRVKKAPFSVGTAQMSWGSAEGIGI